MALGSMNYNDARARARDMENSASSLDSIIAELRKEMNSLEDVLKSDGADSLLATYKVLDAKIDSYPGKVRDFKKFLLKAVDQYEADDLEFKSEVE